MIEIEPIEQWKSVIHQRFEESEVLGTSVEAVVGVEVDVKRSYRLLRHFVASGPTRPNSSNLVTMQLIT